MRCGALDWKYCPGLELDDEGFDFIVLSEFRSRLVAGAMEMALLEALLARLGDRPGRGGDAAADRFHPCAGPDPGPEPAGAGRGERPGGTGGAGGRGAGLAGRGHRRVLAGGLTGTSMTSGCRTARPSARTWRCGTAGTATTCCGRPTAWARRAGWPACPRCRRCGGSGASSSAWTAGGGEKVIWRGDEQGLRRPDPAGLDV